MGKHAETECAVWFAADSTEVVQNIGEPVVRSAGDSGRMAR